MIDTIWLVAYLLLLIAIFGSVLAFAWADDKLNTQMITTDMQREVVLFTVCISGGGFISIAFFLGIWWAFS